MTQEAGLSRLTHSPVATISQRGISDRSATSERSDQRQSHNDENPCCTVNSFDHCSPRLLCWLRCSLSARIHTQPPLAAMSQANDAAAKSAQEAEYLQLYQHMQSQAAGTPAAVVPTPEAFVAALSSAAEAAEANADDSDSADDDDPDADRQSFVFPGLTLSPAALLSFRLSSWHPVLRKHTIPTRFVPLPDDFVEYLIEDGVWIPEELAPVQPGNFIGRDSAFDTAAERKAEAARWRATIEEMSPSDDEAEEAAEEAAAAKQLARQSQPFFPALVSQIQSAMAALGGDVFPSLDWHAPTDASWISTERVAKCSTVGDILLLLKSSDKAQEEVEDPFFECSKQDARNADEAPAANAAPAAAATPAVSASADPAAASSASSSIAAVPADLVASFVPTLALRKWSTLHASKLFRCFLWRGSLLAISQLGGDYFEFLQGVEEREAIQDAIEGWIEDESITEKLRAAPLCIDHAVMDLYIDMSERVWCVKIKPFWPAATDSLLFTWREIYELTQQADKAAVENDRKKAEMRAALAAAPPMAAMTALAASSSSAPASSSSSFDLPSSWPAPSSLSVPFRVVTSSGAGLDVLRAVNGMKSRFPSEGFDLSDGAAIEKWIHRVEHGDLKQK